MAVQNATTIVGYTVNQSSVAQAVAANQSVAMSYQDVAQAAAALGLTEAEFNALAGTQVSATTQQTTANVQLAQSYTQVAQSATQAATAQQSAASSGGGGISLGGARSALRAGGFLLGSEAGGGALRGVGQIVTLTSALGPVGVIAGIAALALRGLSDAEQKAAEKAKLYNDALSGVVGSTTQDIQKQIAAEEQRKAAFKESQTNLQKFSDQFAENFKLASEPNQQEAYLKGLFDISDALSAATNGTITDAAQLRDALASGQAVIDESTGKISFLNLALGTTAVAANDAAAALKQYSDDQVKAAQRDIEINNLTKEQRDEKARQDMADYDLLQQRIEAGGLTVEASIELRAEQQNLLTDYNKLTGTTNTYADALEREKAAKEFAKTATDNYFDALAKEGEIRDEITQTLEDIATVRSDEAAQEVQIVQENGERVAQITQDNADAVAKILRDQGRADTDAIRNRDVVAKIKADERAKDQLEDQSKADSKALAQQARSEERSLTQAREAEQKKLTTLQHAYAQEQVDLTNVISAEHALISQAQQATLQSTYQTYGEMALAAYNGGKQMVQSLINGFLAGFTPLPPVTGTAANSAYTNAIQGIVDSRIRQIWEG